MLTAGRRAALVLALAGCGSPAVVDLDAGADGRTIRLAEGSRLRLVLPENPSTGYRWRIAADAAPVLRLEEDASMPGGTAPGSPGTHRWVFRAARPGQAVLRLDHARPWEAVPPAAQVTVTVQVGG